MLSAQLAVSQGYPNKPIRLVVPNSPGGGVDILASLVTPRISEGLGQPVVVDNRVGAGGAIGAKIVAEAAPDGYTLLAAFDSFTVNPFLFKNVSCDVVQDFTPIALLVRSPLVLIVTSKLGATRFADFVQLATTKGGALNAATASSGTPEAFAAWIKAESTRWSTLIRERNIHLDRRAGVELIHRIREGLFRLIWRPGPTLQSPMRTAWNTALAWFNLKNVGPTRPQHRRSCCTSIAF